MLLEEAAAQAAPASELPEDSKIGLKPGRFRFRVFMGFQCREVVALVIAMRG